MAQRWPADVPTLKASDTHTADQLTAIATVLTRVEADHSIPFDPPPTDPPPPRPAAVVRPPAPDEGAAVTAADVNTLLASCDGDAQLQVAVWHAEARRAERPFDPRPTLTGRRFDILRAAIACATHLTDDEMTRAALALVLGKDLDPSTPVGAYLGALTIAEAQHLHDVAERFAAGHAPTTVDDTGHIRFTA